MMQLNLFKSVEKEVEKEIDLGYIGDSKDIHKCWKENKIDEQISAEPDRHFTIKIRYVAYDNWGNPTYWVNIYRIPVGCLRSKHGSYGNGYSVVCSPCEEIK